MKPKPRYQNNPSDEQRVLQLYDQGHSEQRIAGTLLMSRHEVNHILKAHHRKNGKYKYREGAYGMIGIIRNDQGQVQDQLRYHKIYDAGIR